MGCYDTVHSRCPVCRAKVATQSKAGECLQKHYHASSVPGAIVMDIVGEKEDCPGCSAPLIWNMGFDVSSKSRPKRFRVFLDELTHPDGYKFEEDDGSEYFD